MRDVENLREHYVLTLRHWVRNLENHAGHARQAADESTYRTWRLYMAGSAHFFETGQLNVYQSLLAKPTNGKSGLPLTNQSGLVLLTLTAAFEPSTMVRFLGSFPGDSLPTAKTNRELKGCLGTKYGRMCWQGDVR